MKLRAIVSIKTGKVEEYTIYPGSGPIPPLVKPPDSDEPKDTAPPEPEKDKDKKTI